MRNKRCRCLSLIMSVLVFFSILIVPAADQVSAASKKTYYLPVKTTAYQKIGDSWELDKDACYSFSFNSKGDLTKYRANIGFPGTTTIRWTYARNGKPEKAIVKTKSFSYVTTLKYNSKGKLTSFSTFSPGDGETRDVRWTRKYCYNKKGYAYRIKSTLSSLRGKYSIRYHKNGIPSKITKGKNIFRYNKQGLLTESAFDGDSEFYEYSYDSKGRISDVISYSLNENGEKIEGIKIVYTYGKAKTTDKKKYIGFMGGTVWGDSPITDVTGYPFPEHIAF